MTDELPRSRAQILKDALSKAEARPDHFMDAIRAEIANSGIPRNPDGSRPKFRVRFRPISPTAGYHPNSQAALGIHRWGTIFGGPNAPARRNCERVKKNGQRCGMVANKGSRWCRRHGGASATEDRLRRMFKDYRPDRALLGLAALRQIARRNMIPNPLLTKVPEFAEAYHRARFGVSKDNPLFEHLTYGERRAHHEACVMLALAYLAAWENVQLRGDWKDWMECARRARQLGLGPS